MLSTFEALEIHKFIQAFEEALTEKAKEGLQTFMLNTLGIHEFCMLANLNARKLPDQAMSKLNSYLESLAVMTEQDKKDNSIGDETADQITIAIHHPYSATTQISFHLCLLPVMASQLQQNPLFCMHFFRTEE